MFVLFKVFRIFKAKVSLKTKQHDIIVFCTKILMEIQGFVISKCSRVSSKLNLKKTYNTKNVILDKSDKFLF